MKDKDDRLLTEILRFLFISTNLNPTHTLIVARWLSGLVYSTEEMRIDMLKELQKGVKVILDKYSKKGGGDGGEGEKELKKIIN
jgi:hypothetical protein